METENQTIEPESIAPADQAIALRIVGGDLLLAGRFGQWMPLVLSEGENSAQIENDEHDKNKAKGDKPANDVDPRLSTAQVLFDVTSNRTVKSNATDLFSFTASDVETVSNQAYKIKGKLRAHGQSADVEALLRSPAAHTPFFVIVFRFDRQKFAGLWSGLEDRIDGSGQGELRPTAWLRAPDLAAA
jgi:hypothetical protein